MSNLLGKGTNAHQISIDEKVDVDNINNIFLNNIKKIKDYCIINPDYFLEKIIKSLETNKQLNFPLNKHIEIYINKNLENFEKLIKYVLFRYKFHLAGTQKINLGYPPYLLIETVSTCNLKCPFCYQTDKTFTRKPFMGTIDFEFFKSIIDQADKLNTGAITIGSRGEPTMHKKFSEMLDYLSTKKNILEKKLNTNGSYLTEKLCHSIFKNKLTHIVISSDHYIKEDYERLRVGSNFEKIVKNVDELFYIRKKFYPDSKTEIRVSGVDNDKDLNREEFKKFWIKRSDHVSASLPLERWNTYENPPHPLIEDACEQLWDRMYVWFDGKVNPCDADYKSRLSFGNAKELSLKELWNNKIIENMRKLHFANNRCKINPCDRCGVTFV